MIAKIRLWLHDKSPIWIPEFMIQWSLNILCFFTEHEVVEDICGKPAHDYCCKCMKTFPNKAEPVPYVGRIVCNCKYEHMRIVEVQSDGDTIALENGFTCSFTHCCDRVPHPNWEHPKS